MRKGQTPTIDGFSIEKEIQRVMARAVKDAVTHSLTTSSNPPQMGTTSGMQRGAMSLFIRVVSAVLGISAIVISVLVSDLAVPLMMLVLCIVSVKLLRRKPKMAAELRQEILKGNVADGTAAASADSEFRNDSSAIIHIRKIHYTHLYHTAAIDERGLVELSKSPTVASLTPNNVFYTYPQQVGGGGAVGDSSGTINGGTTYGKGQLTLEPNESLFVNVSKTSGGGLAYIYVIEYEFS